MLEKKEDCKFCKIINGEEAHIVFEDKDSLAFLDDRPLFPGHTLLLPRAHYETLVDLPSHLIQPLFKNAQLLSYAIREALRAEGTFIAINNRISQSVPHLHIHIVPRRKDDGLKGFFWPRHSYRNKEHIQKVKEEIRSVIERIK